MRIMLTIQGWFYLLTGLWPIFHMHSFEMVSGKKTDKWLVKTVGLLIASSGIIFIKYPESDIALSLAVLNALALTAIDIFYVSKKVISKIYLADAAVEIGFVLTYYFLA